ncbi:hypothetical protein TrVE_jg7648 [Triparma verrucosa]|uniref:Uncharacterized protein n=1 Tax=Triparma verrucosa TaxID=1606542 RepID=A0A9W7F0R2_9STRA|nr:hypothetical protein TrVE_jg7648 [Triparma verrucosa]
MSPLPNSSLPLYILVLLSLALNPALSSNWAQLAGKRAQNVAKPYIPLDNDKYQDANYASRPMWSARWGHASAVFNSSTPRNYLTIEENSERTKNIVSRLLVLGGDDQVLDDYIVTDPHAKMGKPDGWKAGEPHGYGSVQHDGVRGGKTAKGGMLNDVWYSLPATGSEKGWEVVDDETASKVDASEVIQSQMKWKQSNPGRINPATWPSNQFGRTKGFPLTYKDWIQCQDVFVDQLDLPPTDPDSICYLDPLCAEGSGTNERKAIDMFDYTQSLAWPEQCSPQAVWKNDNMWSPRRGHKAVVASGWTEFDKLYVMGGRAREYARMDDDRLVGGVLGPRISTELDRITTREETILKNDIWVSEDGLGERWTLVNPGCESPQQDVLLQTEEWSGFEASYKNVGQKSQMCVDSSDCYGVAECRSLAEGSPDKVCVCPMWSPRENHAVSVQHTYKRSVDGASLDHAEDYIYVVGGFVNIRKSFCGSHSCGTNGYRFYMDDAWVSNNGGQTWIQFKQAFDSTATGFMGRGAHAVALISQFTDLGQTRNYDEQDQLWVFGGESGDDETGETSYLNDVWRVDLPKKPCCWDKGNCGDPEHPLQIEDVGTCLPGRYDWKNSTMNAEWSGRAGHSVVVEPPAGINKNIQRVVIVGGHNEEEGVLGDVWSWGFQDPDYANLYFECKTGAQEYDCPWFKDYQRGQWYRTNMAVDVDIYDEVDPDVAPAAAAAEGEEGEAAVVVVGDSSTNDMYYGPGHGNPEDPGDYMPTNPQQYYFYSESDISMLGVRIFLPEPNIRRVSDMPRTDPTMYPELSEQDVEDFRTIGINTISDLLSADVMQIIRLRGYDFPGGDQALNVGDKVCSILAQAKAIDEKCTIRHIQEYDLEHQLPKNVDPSFDPSAPIGEDEHWQYRGGGYDPVMASHQSNSHGKIYGQAEEEEECDEECEIANWNGCDYLMMEDADGLPVPAETVDVNGVGPVPVPESIRDPTNDMQEVKCRQNPGARTMATAELFEQEVLIMGGKRTMAGEYLQDVWVRDDHLPTANIKQKPGKLTSESKFVFATDRRACIFEYKIVDAEEKMDVIPWTATTRSMGADVLTLLDENWPWSTGPGTGEYLFYVRAIDPAGNVGYQFQEENVYLWTFVSPLPWPWIIGGAAAGFLLIVLAYLEYRRRKKKKAMERYAIKRMRRKFKGAQKGGDDKKADWRALAAEDKDDKKKKKKRKKKDKDKKKKKKGLKDRTKDKGEKKKKKKKDKKKKKGKDKDKDKSKSKDKDKKRKDKDKKKSKDSKEKDYDKKKDKGGSTKEKDKEKKKSGKEADKDRKKDR